MIVDGCSSRQNFAFLFLSIVTSRIFLANFMRSSRHFHHQGTHGTVSVFFGILVLLGILVVPLSQRLGAPILLIVLGTGMLLGEDGPGGIHFSDFASAYAIGSLALAIILFAGGLETDVRKTRRALAPSLLLSTLGVVITAVIVGVAASYILNISIEMGLLFGAVVSSTDAAATFLLIQQSGVAISDRLKNRSYSSQDSTIRLRSSSR